MDSRIGLRMTVVFILVLWVASYASAKEVSEIKGVIVNSSDDSPIEDAIIEAIDGGVSRILSDAKGKYRFFLVDAPTITLKVTKEGFKPFTRQLEPTTLLEVEVRLEPVKEAGVSIVMAAFKKGRYIKGQVSGLKQGEHERYKLLVYVLTDKWYIHPYNVNQEGKGYASIKSDGSWTIETEWRGYQAFKIAFLVVDKDYYPPAVVDISEGDPDQDLIGKIHPHYEKIQKAPEGI